MVTFYILLGVGLHRCMLFSKLAEVYLRSGCFRAIKFYIERKNMLNKY